jgi:hypothetical protein
MEKEGELALGAFAPCWEVAGTVQCPHTWVLHSSLLWVLLDMLKKNCTVHRLVWKLLGCTEIAGFFIARLLRAFSVLITI